MEIGSKGQKNPIQGSTGAASEASEGTKKGRNPVEALPAPRNA